MNKKILIILSMFLVFSCGSKNGKSDAFGNFEATDIIISSEVNGKILNLNLEEGQLLEKDQVVGLIDTQILYLQKEQVIAQKEAVSSQFSNIIAQIDVLKEQKKVLETEKNRIENLLKDSAATGQQLDNVNGEISVVDKQVSVIKAQNSAVLNEIDAYYLQIDQINNQIEKSILKSPINGTILEKYVEENEIATLGKPLYKIADLSVMNLTVYVDGLMLPEINTGQKVKVLIDKDEKEFYTTEGEITWISDQAEFTPKIIQTKKERINLVYAVKVEVPNDGRIKIGMPGEVRFNTTE